MKGKRVLAAFLLGVVLCFVSGVGYGEIPQWVIDTKAPYIDVELLETRVSYMIRNPTSFLSVSFYYDPTGFTGEKAKLPKSVNTRGKIFISVVDNRGQFSYKSGVALLDTFKRHLKVIYSFIDIAIDMDSDIVATLHSKEGIPLGYFY